jgi:hypothetical protein
MLYRKSQKIPISSLKLGSPIKLRLALCYPEPLRARALKVLDLGGILGHQPSRVRRQLHGGIGGAVRSPLRARKGARVLPGPKTTARASSPLRARTKAPLREDSLGLLWQTLMAPKRLAGRLRAAGSFDDGALTGCGAAPGSAAMASCGVRVSQTKR